MEKKCSDTDILGIFSRLIFLFILLNPTMALAQLSFSAPATDSTVKSCDDFPVQEFNDPWDLSNTADINNYVVGQDIANISNPTISGGIFSGTVTNTGGVYKLWTTASCGSFPSNDSMYSNSPARWGSDLNGWTSG